MSGLLALLDDIGTLAKLTMSTLDDTASMAVKTSAKVSAAAVDDVAATPQYVTGIAAERELPIIKRIAVGSLRNKLLIILPVGLVLSWLAPWLLPVALVIGGSYLCFEGGEKLWHAVAHRWGARHASLHSSSHSHSHADSHGGGDPEGAAGQTGEAAQAASAATAPTEDTVVRQAVTTDFVLSTEIMLLALAEVQQESSAQRVAVLIAIAGLITFAVYGLVAALIKLDDLGVHLAQRGPSPALRRLGRGVVRSAPVVFNVIGVIGTVAMLWVGGQILVHNLEALGVHGPHHLVETLTHPVVGINPVLDWLAVTAVHCVWGAVVGLVLTGVVGGLGRLIGALRGGRRR